MITTIENNKSWSDIEESISSLIWEFYQIKNIV